jgi:hypothetical protein
MASVERLTYRYLFMHPSGTELAQLAELVEQGKLKVIADKTYLFSNIADALAYVESGRAKGKVVVTMGCLPTSIGEMIRCLFRGSSYCSVAFASFRSETWRCCL